MFAILNGNGKVLATRFGGEILENEIIIPDNVNVGQIFTNNVWIDDPQEIAEQQKQSRISELKLLITNKKLLDMDCTTEQAELRGLLGL